MTEPDEPGQGFRPQRRRVVDLGSAPAQQVVRTAILRGFDRESGIATFKVKKDGRYEEMAVSIGRPGPGGNPLYQRIYETMLNNLGSDSAVPALHIRIEVPINGEMPVLLQALPAAPDKDQRFQWKGAQLRWTDDLDEKVDVDFDWRSQQFGNQFLGELLEEGAGSLRMQEVLAESERIFLAQASAMGITKTPAEIRDYFRSNAPRGISDILRGSEAADGGARAVRYDIRYQFAQQCAHVSRDPDAMLSALLNYSMQGGVSEAGAMSAAAGVQLSDGSHGSLAQAHQEDLIRDDMLLAANPGMESHKEIFASYSHEAVRGAISRAMAGAMDVAGIPAARPEIDHLEDEKKNLDVEVSLHKQAIAFMPEEARSAGPQVRAGAYLATIRNYSDGSRKISAAEVGMAQSRAVPDRKGIPKDQKQPDRIAEGFHGMLERVEKGLDMM